MSNLLDELAGPEDENNKSGKESKDNNKKIINNEKYILSDEQKIAILKIWNESPPNKPPGLKQIYGVVFPGETIDHRSQKGLAVRQFLAERQLTNFKRVRGSYDVKQDIEITDEIREYIIKNAKVKNATEITSEILGFPVASTCKAVLRVKEVIDTVDRRILGDNSTESEEKTAIRDYYPPKTNANVCNKINEYCEGQRLDAKTLSSKDAKCCTMLINYLHTPRFIYQINSYLKKDDRRLFESEFIRWTWDKPDLTQEDIDQYIVWATEVVISHNIQKTINLLQNEQTQLVEAGEKMSLTLVEAINSARKEYNDSIGRQDKLNKSLTQERGKRLDKQIKENASFAHLVAMAREKDNRDRMVKLGIKKKELLKKEIEDMMSMSELRLKLLGISENELLHSP